MIKKILVFILIVIYFALLFPVFFGLTFFRTFLSQFFLKNEFIPQTYEKTIILAKDAFRDIPGMKIEDFDKNFRQLFPPDVYSNLLQNFLDEIIIGIKKWQPSSGFEIILKDSTKRQFIDRLEKIVDLVPVCPLSIFPSEKNFCMPKNFSEAEKLKLKKKLRDEADLKIPSRIVISQEDLKQSEKFLMFLSFSLKNYNQIIAVFIGLPLLLLVSIGLVIFQPLYRIFMWEGFLLLFTSFIPLTFWLIFKNFPDFIRKQKEISEKAYENIAWLMSFLTDWNKNTGFIILFLSILILTAVIFFRKKLSK